MDINEQASAPPETRFLNRPEGRIAYDLYGVGNSGPVAICAPGMGDHRTTYRHLAPALAAAGWRVAALDLRGHGDSDTGFTDHSTRALADDMTALAEELDGGPALLIGNSMGGTAAAWAAAARPDLVRGVVLIAAFLRGEGVQGPMKWALKLALLRPWGPRFTHSYLSGLFSGRTADDHGDHVGAIRTHLSDRRRFPEIIATVGNAFHAPPARLDDVRAPVLVVMGELDSDFPDPAAEAAWQGERLGAEVLTVPDAGHYPQAQRSDVVAPAVVAFARAASRG
ncbi:pimeloyl-ACP methyl ester carboxylesterase [Murinocardiopsis flavida]|uniref:Pimeloyl-ACP methyl ester carboxylesterase n=1 Tax=Murinocardiopsis flavida TaxID=645275 RepID=A0A2P8DK73_9ACTN|nr:alpha/beta hydrolase [Murinocardiopsis flavida]PSK97614.1 pimeloyl-ACP methyl ester carboxylesterase [Murinocardiopsis flavida]